jgi:hypothetical protein
MKVKLFKSYPALVYRFINHIITGANKRSKRFLIINQE